MASEQVLDVSDEAARRRTWRRRRLRRIAVPVAFVLVLLASQLAIALHSYRANRTEALRLSDTVIESATDRIVTQVDAYLTPAVQMVNLAARLASQEVSTPEDMAELAPFGRGMLRAYPQLAMFSIGTVAGDYTGPRKMLDGTLATQIVDRDAERVVFEGWVRELPGGSTEREPTNDGYDPRSRPWYQGATASGGLFWTDVYMFFDPVVPGVTASQPVITTDGRLLGVVGIDIELAALSTFLADLEIGKSGRATIVDAEGNIVAHPRLDASLSKVSDGQTLHISEVTDTALLRAFNRHRIEGDGAHEAEIDGKSYRITSRSLPTALGGDWIVLVAVPEDDFIGFVGRNNRRALILSLSVLGLASVLAGLFAVQGIRADRQAQLVLEQRARLEGQSRALSALGRERRLLDPDDPGGLRPLTELASETAGVRRCSVWLREGERLHCVDAYDRSTAGHTAGAVVDAIPELLEALRTQPTVIAPSVVAEPRLRGLYRKYLAPLEINAVVLVPIMVGCGAVGALVLEDAHARDAWPPDTTNFVQALAAVLSVRFRRLGEDDRAAAPEPMGERQLDASGNGHAHPAPPIAALSIERREGATVLVIDCEGRAGEGGDKVLTPVDLVNRLVCCIDAWSERLGVEHVAVLGERIVVASKPADSAVAASLMAEAALELQAQAHEHDLEDRVAVRMGLHTGELTLANIGADQRLPELSGPAVRVASLLAKLGTRDGIQTSETTYRLIRSRFLLQDRGRFYADGFGEISAYFLNDKLQSGAAPP